MKRIFITILLLYSVSVITAQINTTITGFVTSKEHESLPAAGIFINELRIGISTNEAGKFRFSEIIPGSYTLTVSLIGYQPEQIKFKLNKGDSLHFNIVLNKISLLTETIVVTGTRTEKEINNNPIRTDVILSSDYNKLGLTRLSDVLNEQGGLVLVDDFGKGIQMQGLDPDYTLILIDGEPIIGRTAGTIDLSRFIVNNLKQIEIVKGPSSSLYGSEALAGVINLISGMSDSPYSINLHSYYKTNNTIDLSAKTNIVSKNFESGIFFNRLSSDGYNLMPGTISLTSPEYSSYNIKPLISYRFTDSSLLKISGRLLRENQNNSVMINPDGTEFNLKQVDKLTEWNAGLSYSHAFSKSIKTEFRLYSSRYLTDSRLTFSDNDNTYDHSKFDQYLNKAEIKSDIILSNSNYLITGAGYFNESVTANRIDSGVKKSNSHYFFLQDEWIAGKLVDLVFGARYDWHSEYVSRISPKVSILVKPFKTLNIRLSIGSGFKAPTFQQLYLDFVNPQVGYSVFGSSNIHSSIQKLLEEGQVARILIDPNSIEKISAENSVAFNLGIEFNPFNFLNASVNLFRNNVEDLIEASPIAVKTNGQSVFTYFNLNRIYTQGIETQLNLKFLDDFAFSISYQYLEAIDQDVLQRIRNGEIIKPISGGRIRKVEESEYGGLLNRSKHSGVMKLGYINNALGLSANIRCILRSKFGFGDTNGNLVLDDKREYVPGYALLNLALSKEAGKYFNLLFGIENILDKTNPEFIPSLSGRIIYGGIQLQIND